MIPQHRVASHHIGGATFHEPDEVVRWLGAVQAQDYLGALWAVGLRMRSATEASVEQALADRRIVRTWPARGTLHFVAAADVRWMLDLLAPRVIMRSAGRYRQLGLDEATFARSKEVLTGALAGGKQLPREALFRVLDVAGISPAGQRGIHILSRLAQEGVLCFGTRQGKQQTFTLLEEWITPAEPTPRDEALAELTRRYFTSRGPATVQDFVWWSGLTTVEARTGLELARPHLVQEKIGGRTYWLPSASSVPGAAPPTACLLPAFDEYLVGYRDRDAVLAPEFVRRTNAGGGMLSPTILIDGQVAGTWKRTLKKGTVVVAPSWFAGPTADQVDAVENAAAAYSAFLGLTLEMTQKAEIK
jgi:hypothetical protein